MAEGSIMATIMAAHMAVNMIAVPRRDWPGICIHIMDMVQPPGMFMPPAMEWVQ